MMLINRLAVVTFKTELSRLKKSCKHSFHHYSVTVNNHFDLGHI